MEENERIEKLEDRMNEYWREYADLLITETISNMNEWLDECREGEMSYMDMAVNMKEISEILEMRLS